MAKVKLLNWCENIRVRNIIEGINKGKSKQELNAVCEMNRKFLTGY